MFIQGLPRLHVEVSTSTVGGQLYALLEDCDGSDCIHIGHAIMDLRYHEGGDDLSSTWTPVIGTITAMMEFIAMDAEVYAGHTIRLTLLSHWRRLSACIDIINCNNSRRRRQYITIETHTILLISLIWVPPVCTQ